VRIKICGITNPEDGRESASAGADWVGLNFHPESPRCVDLDRASAIIAALPDSVVPVGVFVDRGPAQVAEIAARVGLEVIQLHGDESAKQVGALQRHGLSVVKAFRLGTRDDVARMKSWLADAMGDGNLPDAVLLDASVPGLSGGSGRTVPDDVLALLPALVADDALAAAAVRLILAGGLTPENVAERIERAGGRSVIGMVDVASGVESSPGRKDPGRMSAFVEAARRARRWPGADA
jgi:phosphoribosylanthranilate isomerase